LNTAEQLNQQPYDGQSYSVWLTILNQVSNI